MQNIYYAHIHIQRMSSLLPVRALLLFCFMLWHLQQQPAHSQDIPAIACPNYFQYLQYGNQYIGKISIPNVPKGTANLEVSFSQRVPLQTNYYGALELFKGQDATVDDIQHGRPISYRVNFPIPNVLPKITLISLNGQVICAGNNYPAPSTELNLRHSLHTSNTRPFNAALQGAADTQFPEISRPAQRPQQFFQPEQQLSQPQRRPRPRPQLQATATQPSSAATQPQNINAVCGREGSTGVTPFVHGGSVLTRGQYPWLTAIYRKQTAGLKFLCGGSLVSARTIVTAGHCFKLYGLTATQIVVYLGRHDLENYGESGVIPRDIRRLLIHPDYNPTSFPDADIAILQMQSAVGFSQFIRPICLWNEPDDARLIEGQTAFVAGWGADQDGNEVSALPKTVDTQIVSELVCLRSLAAYKPLITSRTICAGKRDKTGPCMGDSGGGLMLNRNGRWMLRGVVSAGQTSQQKCNLEEFVIYCDLAKHISWVQSNIVS